MEQLDTFYDPYWTKERAMFAQEGMWVKNLDKL